MADLDDKKRTSRSKGGKHSKQQPRSTHRIPIIIAAILIDAVEIIKLVSFGINAGGFDDPNGMGTGSTPDTLVVYDGTIYQPGRGCGDGIAAIDEDGILHVANSMSVDELHENRIRYAVCYGPVLISNGNPADPETLPESLNPRTAIGQRSDKAMLLLVIDGRQVSSMGASYQDLVEIMQHYGAVNAVNLDGGSSSLMWYNGSYINKTASVIGIRPVPTSILVLQEGQTP